MNAWLALTSALLLGSLGFTVRRLIKPKAESLLEDREALTDDEIYQRFYASSGLEREAVAGLWHEVAHILRVPADRLRPTDEFGKDIGAYWITSEELDVLGETARRRANRKGAAVDLASIRTVDDYVRQLATCRVPSD